MDILISLLIVISLLVAIVVFQSRKDRPAFNVYLHRFSKLLMILVMIFKNIGVAAAQQVRQANWDLTQTHVVTPPVDPSGAPSQSQTCPPVETQKGGQPSRRTRKATWF